MYKKYPHILFFLFVLSIFPGSSFAQISSLEYIPVGNGSINNWLLLGPFSNSVKGTVGISDHGNGCYGYNTDLLVDYGGEISISPYAGQIIHQQYSWKLMLYSSEWIDFNSYYEKNDDVVAYAYVTLKSDKEMMVKLGLSHNDGLKIFLNGEQVYENHTAQLVLNSVPLIVHLKKGDNRLLLKVDEKTGGWGFGLSVKTVNDKEVRGLKIKIPVLNDLSELQAQLFENSRLKDSEPAINEPLFLNFLTRGIALPKTVHLPLMLIDSEGTVLQKQVLSLGDTLQRSYALTFNPQEPKCNIMIEGHPEIQPISLSMVNRKVYNSDPDQNIGMRPYEMVDRPGYDNPLIDFEDLKSWWIHSQKGASARLYRSRAQQMDGSYVARLDYNGKDRTSSVEFGPPEPVLIPDNVDNLGLWIYGNNWGWVPDPATPSVAVNVVLVNAKGEEQSLFMGNVNWKEWFLKWRHFTRSDENLYFKSIRIDGCANKENLLLFFDSVNFDRERWEPLNLKPLPDMVPFLTTKETMIPVPGDSVVVSSQRDGRKFIARFVQNEKNITYSYSPESGTLEDIRIESDSGQKIEPFINGDIKFEALESNDINGFDKRLLDSVEKLDGGIVYHWNYIKGELKIPYSIALAIRYNSLIIDIAVQAEQAGELNLGHLKSNKSVKLVRVPMLTYGGPDPQVVCSGDLFIFALIDHYYTHASMLFARNKMLSETEVVFNGGSRYMPKTDGRKNPLKERIILSVSSNFHDVLPTIPHSPSPMGKITRSRLWKENWGMSPDKETHEKFYQGLKVLRDYGVSQFIVRHHEETWRDGGESFTLRLRAAPKKGGDKSLIEYVKRVKDLGFICGLYNNYIDFAPVNANWSPDRVARNSNKDFVDAWPRCYTLKPYLAQVFEAEYSPKIHQKYGSNTVYCDVHTAVTPWARVDFDDRVPEAGMLRAQHKAYSILLNNEKKAYEGPVFSEGLFHWFYAGLTDGNYGQLKDSDPDKVPALVDFDLLRIHPLEVSIGMGNPGMFFHGGIKSEERNSRSRKFDRFITSTIAYGHNGYLIDMPIINNLNDMKITSSWGIPAIMKSYYMMQQLQSRYALVKVEKISYCDGNQWFNTSDAIRNDSYKRGQIKTLYKNGLVTVVNLNEVKNLTVEMEGRKLLLTPNSYAAQGENFFEMSAMMNGQKIDFVYSPEYLYMDGRGKLLKTDKISATNSAVVLKDKDAVWLIPIDEREQVAFLLAEMGLNKKVKVIGSDQSGKILTDKVDYHLSEGWLTVNLSDRVFKYKIVNDY
jgi:hypothetical protein